MEFLVIALTISFLIQKLRSYKELEYDKVVYPLGVDHDEYNEIWYDDDEDDNQYYELRIMNSTVILIAFIVTIFITTRIYSQKKGNSLFGITTTVQIPPYDFLIIDYIGTTIFFTTPLEPDVIIEAVERTKNMGAIPPTTITLYNKGKIVGRFSCGLRVPANQQPKVKLFSKECVDQRHYNNKKKRILRGKKKVYILKDDTNPKEYTLDWYEY